MAYEPSRTACLFFLLLLHHILLFQPPSSMCFACFLSPATPPGNVSILLRIEGGKESAYVRNTTTLYDGGSRVVEINTMIWAALGTMLQHIPLLPFYVRIWSCVPPNYTVPTSCATMCSAQIPPSPCSPVSARVSVRRRTSPSPYSVRVFPPPLSQGQNVGTNCAKPRLPPPPPRPSPRDRLFTPPFAGIAESSPHPLPCSLSFPLLPPSLRDP